jgi:serine/threonine protein kinase
MNLAPELSLERYNDRFPNVFSLSRKLFILYSTVQGLRFLKEKDIIHVDMQPSNVLIGRGMQAKVKGFGLAAYKGKRPDEVKPQLSIKETFVKEYSNPSIFLYQEANSKYSHKQDIYDLGVMMYELILGIDAITMPEAHA